MSEEAPQAPRRAAFFMLVPLFSVLAVMAAYGLLFGVGMLGRAADGERVRLTYSGCPEARPILEARVTTMGLGEPVWSDPMTLVATLPSEADVAAQIPATLARTGKLEIYQDDNNTLVFTNAEITGASPRLDLTMIPYTVMSLTDEAWNTARTTAGSNPKGQWRFELDGEVFGYQSNEVRISTPEFEVTPNGDDDRHRLQLASERALVLGSGPLPCPVTLDARETVAP